MIHGRQRRRRRVEFFCLFIAIPIVLRLLPIVSRETGFRLTPPLIPFLITLAGIMLILLLRTTPFRLVDLVDLSSPTRRDWRRMVIRLAILAAVLTAALLWVRPEGLLRFPRERTRLWLMVMMLYPLLSVMPQGIIYRACFHYRYAPMFPRALQTAVAAAVFSLAHLPFANVYALAFTFAGGWMFLVSYRRTRSLLFAAVEHALYGNFIFTIGWGEYFFHAGTLRLLEHG